MIEYTHYQHTVIVRTLNGSGFLNIQEYTWFSLQLQKSTLTASPYNIIFTATKWHKVKHFDHTIALKYIRTYDVLHIYFSQIFLYVDQRVHSVVI